MSVLCVESEAYGLKLTPSQTSTQGPALRNSASLQPESCDLRSNVQQPDTNNRENEVYLNKVNNNNKGDSHTTRCINIDNEQSEHVKQKEALNRSSTSSSSRQSVSQELVGRHLVSEEQSRRCSSEPRSLRRAARRSSRELESLNNNPLVLWKNDSTAGGE